MIIKKVILGLIATITISCNATQGKRNTEDTATTSDIKVVSAMKNVMRKGELGGSVDLDTISDKNGLYGLGPVSYLKGELLINNGVSYVSKIDTDGTMYVQKRFDISAPFFVYGNVTKWQQMNLPAVVKSVKDLEQFIDSVKTDYKKPFVFKLAGQVAGAKIHVQNLPKGTKVSTPKEAHQGQVNFAIKNEEAEIIGFFSTQHQGIFTHHDSFLHMHLITANEKQMGHLDELQIGTMRLYVPKILTLN